MARPTNLTSLWRSAITSNPIPTSSSPSASLLRRGLSSSTVAAATSAELGASSNRLGVKARKLRMIILGAPGAGKGTQTERLLKKWDIKTVGVGDLLRQEIIKGTELGRKAEGVMKAGTLLPDEIVLKIVEPHLLDLKDKDWILDGFPRKASQAILLDQLLERLGKDSELNCVVNLAVPDDVILGRIEDRWVHAPSGRTYSASFHAPKVAGIDDVTGEPLTRRSDDNAVTFAKRLASYHHENDTLLSHYSNVMIPGEGVEKLVTLAGRTSDEIYPMLEKVLEERFAGLVEK